jgi:glycyl-tRNA synthetase beta chain
VAELLLEILSEEIPARMQRAAAERLRHRVVGLLAAHDLGPRGHVHAHATPRRLVLIAEGVAVATAGRTSERRGPRVDAPDSAQAGFRKALLGLDHVLEQREEAKGLFWYALIREPARATSTILADALPAELAAFDWPKSMRWGAGEIRWVRPIESILCLLEGEVVPVRFGDVPCGRTTRGHRFMAPASFAVTGAADYLQRLERAKVMLAPERRAEAIRAGAVRCADEAGLVLREDPALIEEIAGLVEWPVVLLGTIDPAFMDIPPEVLTGTMRANQKYLALETRDGQLADRFVVVANLEASDGGHAIVAGNERVLRARFWDARHFWEQDRRTPLEDRLPLLERMVFHEQLGTVRQRVDRLVALAGALVPFVPGADRTLAARSALLAKCDLVTGMVGEFPELQGIMGGHYAAAQGELPAVARAIREHYQPRGPDDACPRAPDAVVLALADKLDMLAGFFAVGIRPSGSKDPFALRRAALGVIRLIRENGLRLPVLPLLERAVAALGGQGAAAVAGELLGFLHERLKVILREEGVRHDRISAVLATGPDDDLVRLVARARALEAFLAGEDGRNLLAGLRRAGNIVRIEAKKDGAGITGAVEAQLLREPAEQALHAALAEARERLARALAVEDWTGAMATLAALRPPVDRFFDEVLVNAPETMLRANRLRLLQAMRSALDPIAAFDLIEETASG